MRVYVMTDKYFMFYLNGNCKCFVELEKVWIYIYNSAKYIFFNLAHENCTSETWTEWEVENIFGSYFVLKELELFKLIENF